MKKLTDERYEEIKKAAADLLEKANIHKIPIDPLQIATTEGIKLIPYSYFPQKKRTLLLLASEDGFCCRDGLQEIIYFNDEGRCYERIRQTIMHEIGHIVLEHAGGIFDEVPLDVQEQEEAEARFFAKYILCPPPLLQLYDIHDFYDIYTLFHVSMEAAQYAMNYYQKWQLYAGCLREYERKMLRLFPANQRKKENYE